MSLLPGVTEDATVFGRFQRTAVRFPERPFLAVLPETARVYGIASGAISYREASNRVGKLADAYREAGYGGGHRVGLLLQNRPDFVFHWFALNALGASVVPINPDLRAAELEYLIAHSEMRLAVAISERVGNLREAAAATGAVLTVIASDDAPPAASLPAVAGHFTRATECALLYTSGTTGKPKGCVLSNDYFLIAGEWYATVGGLCDLRSDPPERMLTPLPLFHMNAMAYSLIATLTVGRLDRHSRPLPSEELVGQRQDVRCDGRALSRRHAGDADVGPRKPLGQSTTTFVSASAQASTRACMRRSRRDSAFRCSKPGR